MMTDIESQLAILRQGLKERRAFMRQQELSAFTTIKAGEQPRNAVVSSASKARASVGSAKR